MNQSNVIQSQTSNEDVVATGTLNFVNMSRPLTLVSGKAHLIGATFHDGKVFNP